MDKSGPVALILACFVSWYNLGSRARASRLAWPVVFGAWLLFILGRRHMTGVLDEKRRLARRWKKDVPSDTAQHPVQPRVRIQKLPCTYLFALIPKVRSGLELGVCVCFRDKNPIQLCRGSLVLQFQVSVSMQRVEGWFARQFVRAAFEPEPPLAVRGWVSHFWGCLLSPWRRRSGSSRTSQSQESGFGRRELVWNVRSTTFPSQAAASLRSAGRKQMQRHHKA